ncbi:MAG: hypothetical protein LUC92_00060 [Clostridiales bacterium]|nr:hypothetical protein [Clostridiales bacterium]
MWFILLILIDLLFFGVQLLLCVKAKKRAVKAIPVCLLLIGFVLCILLFNGVFGEWSGEEPYHQVWACVIGFVIITAGVAADLAIFSYFLNWKPENKKAIWLSAIIIIIFIFALMFLLTANIRYMIVAAVAVVLAYLIYLRKR